LSGFKGKIKKKNCVVLVLVLVLVPIILMQYFADYNWSRNERITFSYCVKGTQDLMKILKILFCGEGSTARIAIAKKNWVFSIILT
jgi:hypothetical protein